MRSKSIRAKRPKRADQERPFTIVGIDFLENDVLSCEERMTYIVLRSFLEDQNKTFGTVQVPMETIAAGASMSTNRTKRAIDKLIEHGYVKRLRPGTGKMNIYEITDYPEERKLQEDAE